MKIENYKEQMSNPSVASIFDVYVPALQMTLRNLKVINKKDGGQFIAFPSFSQERSDGRKDWITYVSFSKEKGEEFIAKVWNELKPFLKKDQFADAHKPTHKFIEDPGIPF